MKKIILGFMLFFAVGTTFTARAQETVTTANIKYWYYPTQNVYYNDATGEYWYYDQPTIKWTMVKQLPPTYMLSDKDAKYEVYYKGPEVWRDNKSHKVKYKIKKDGTVKQKGNKSK